MRPFVRIVSFAIALVVASFAIPPAARADDLIADSVVPFKNLSGSAPVWVNNWQLFAIDGGNVRACISFRNLAQSTATQVRFEILFIDTVGRVVRRRELERRGSFEPKTEIAGKMTLFNSNSDAAENCVTVEGGDPRPVSWSVGVSEVTYQNGARWIKGQPFDVRYDRGGNRLDDLRHVTPTDGPPPIYAPTPPPYFPTPPPYVPYPAPTDTGSAVVDDGATGHGGSIRRAPVPVFGAIAWINGDRKAFGTSIDQLAQKDADTAALAACNAISPNGGCAIVVRMFGSDKRCGVIMTDDDKYSTGRGPDPAKTTKAGNEALVQAGGRLGIDNVVTSVCNTH